MMAQGVDGVILFDRPLKDESPPLLSRRGLPFLRCWSALPQEPSVAFDHGLAMRGVVEYLIELGQKKLQWSCDFLLYMIDSFPSSGNL